MTHISECTDHVRKNIVPPWTCLLKSYNLKAPQGFILNIILFFTAIFATLLRFVQLCWYLKRRKKIVKPTSSLDRKRAYFNVTTEFQLMASVEGFC